LVNASLNCSLAACWSSRAGHDALLEQVALVNAELLVGGVVSGFAARQRRGDTDKQDEKTKNTQDRFHAARLRN